MTPPDAYLYEYSVVRYVTRVDREEFVNIGLVMMCKRQKWIKGEININRERILSFDPRVNIDILIKQTQYFGRKDIPSGDLPVEEKYRWLASVKSAVIQNSPSHPGIITDIDPSRTPEEALEAEFRRLMETLVE